MAYSARQLARWREEFDQEHAGCCWLTSSSYEDDDEYKAWVPDDEHEGCDAIVDFLRCTVILNPGDKQRWLDALEFLGEASVEAYDRSLKPAQLLPRLFLGSVRDASLKDVRASGYGAVLNVAPVETRRQVHDGAVYESLDGITYHSIDARDKLDYDLIGRHADEALAFLARMGAADPEASSGGGCLVHCAAGVNRSAALCVAFLVRVQRWTLLRAVRHVHARRPIVLTNASFRLQLVQLAAQEGLLDELQS